MHTPATPAEHELALRRVAVPTALPIVRRTLGAAFVAALVVPLSAAGAELEGFAETLGSGDLATVRDTSPEQFREFLAGGGDVHAADDAGRSLLWWAALLNPNPEVTRLLLEAGGNPVARSLAGWTPAEISESNPNPAVATLLRIYRGAPEPNRFPPDLPLWRLAYGDWAATASEEAVKTLLDGSAEAAASIRRRGDLLYWAAANPDPGVARLLLVRGADPNAKTSDGWTPLHGAAGNPNPSVARLLQEHGADPNAGLSLELNRRAQLKSGAAWRTTIVGDGISPTSVSDPLRPDIAYGIRHASVSQVRRWLREIARQHPEASESAGFHAELLRSAAAANLDPNVTRLLLDLGADANSESADGWTPLHGAAANPNPAVTQLLLERGADPNAVSADGWTPLHRAAMLGNPETAQLLLDAGARLDAVGEGGRTALHWAARYNSNPAVAQLLLERGAVPTARDLGGATPSLLAWLNRRTEVALLLLGRGPEDAVPPERLLDLQWLSRMGWVELEAVVASASNKQLSAQDGCGRTALHSIVLHASFDIARHGARHWGVRDDVLDALLARSVSLDALDSHGNSLAHYAAAGAGLGARGGAAGGYQRVIAALRNRGVDFSAVGFADLLPVHYSLVGGDFSGFGRHDQRFASWLAGQTGTDPSVDPVDGTQFEGGIVPPARMDACIADSIDAYEARFAAVPAGPAIIAADNAGNGGAPRSTTVGKLASRRAGASGEEHLVARAQSHLTVQSNTVGMEFVTVPGGTFTMGSQSGEADADERPLTRVSINAFSIGTSEVTRGQWVALMGTDPSGSDSCAPNSDCPVVNVSWDDVQQFVAAMEMRSGEDRHRYRLPTEAEWEYAARAGTLGERYSGNLDEIAWHGGNSGGMPHQVKTKTPNPFDLYDMLGNAWEWVGDWYGRYPGTSLTNPTGPATGTRRALRGGGWFGGAAYSRAASRAYENPAGSFNNVGFRLVREDRAVVRVRVGISGTVELIQQNDGSYTLNGNPFSSGDRWTAPSGNQYELTLSSGTWTASYIPVEAMVSLGSSGTSVTLSRAEDMTWLIDGASFKSGGRRTAPNGNQYELTLSSGTWTASYVPVEVMVSLGSSGNTVTLSRAEDMTWSIDGVPVTSGGQWNADSGQRYELTLSNGVWTARLVAEAGSGASGSTGGAGGTVSAPKIYFSQEVGDFGGAIQHANLDGSNVQDLVTGLSRVDGLALDLARGKIYWAAGNKIQRANLDGTGVEDLVTGLDFPSSGLVLAVGGDKIYWVAGGSGDKIQRANLDGTGVQDLVTELNGLTDLALDVGRSKIYWTRGGQIQRANLDGTGTETVVTVRSSPFGLALELYRGKIYWTVSGSALGDKIQRANLDGTGVEDVITGRLLPEGLALDVGAGKMYWTERGALLRANLDGTGFESLLSRNTRVDSAVDLSAQGHPTPPPGKVYWVEGDRVGDIRRANLDGSGVEDLVTDLSAPRGLALDLGAGKMYWTQILNVNSGTLQRGKIRRANLDGSSVEDLVTDLGNPYHLALDVGAGKIYWTDLNSHKIQRANLDGSGVEDLVTFTGNGVNSVNNQDSLALDLDGGRIYWTQRSSTSSQFYIFFANLDGSEVRASVDSGMARPESLALGGGYLYWTSPWEQKIQRKQLGGAGAEDVVTGVTSLGDLTLDLDAGKIYWTKSGQIQRANLDGTGVEQVVTGLHVPTGVAVDPGSLGL